ncbi:uncharacterized protein [Leptinotarsa decemlineata]|uniref:uncharacterized protein n=1 Tax=Leptinotarsa decemlineata TaxID=7539 RepID=UPI003D30837D
MCHHQLLLSCLFVLCFDLSVSKRVFFRNCGEGGFSCTNTKDITFQCPNDTNGLIFMVNQFASPFNIETLKIRDCKNLTISLRCSSEQKNIQYLHINNIGVLNMERLQYQSQLPPKVVLENIGYMETIPSFTFSQIDKRLHTINCFKPKEDFNDILVKNVNIHTVQSNAFNMPNDFGNVTFINVTIHRLQSSAIVTKLSTTSNFFFESSAVEYTESLAFRIYGKIAIFRENKFLEISPNGINGTLGSFSFYKNFVNILQPHSISLISQNVYIQDNRFEYLKSGALEKISPGLLDDISGRNFGRLKFIYEFKGNCINFMDAGCLNPDFEAYETVASDIILSENSIFCSCENSAWLISGTGHGYNTAPIESFYEVFLDEENQNNCSYTCNLPIAKTKMLLQNGKCMDNISMEWLCQNKGLPFLSATTPEQEQLIAAKSASNCLTLTSHVLSVVLVSIMYTSKIIQKLSSCLL